MTLKAMTKAIKLLVPMTCKIKGEINENYEKFILQPYKFFAICIMRILYYDNYVPIVLFAVFLPCIFFVATFSPAALLVEKIATLAGEKSPIPNTLEKYYDKLVSSMIRK